MWSSLFDMLAFILDIGDIKYLLYLSAFFYHISVILSIEMVKWKDHS